MAVDTAVKRYASVTFATSNGSRIPSGETSAFARGTTLGLYNEEAATDPVDGWIASTAGRRWTTVSVKRLFIANTVNRVVK